MFTKGVAAVTGSARGIGRAIALRLANDGFHVALNDIPSNAGVLESLTQEISRKGRKSMVVVGDMSVEEDVKSLMVANAGICITKPIMETTLDEWERLFAVNSRGIFLCYKHAGEYMINQGRGGRMIAASSIAGKQGTELYGAYSATKFAVRGMTQSFAKALGKHGITVNAYAPGAIDTDMLNANGAVMGDVERFRTELRADTAVGSLGIPADVAGIVSYLASKESRFITVQTEPVDGGQCRGILTKPIMETTLDDWERLFAINSRGVFLCYKYAGEYMINQGRGGRLIAASSIAGKQGAEPYGAYSATKFAVRGMTQSFSKALGKHGITVNAYVPGPIDGDMRKIVNAS
ncbi:hypothetical protein BD779DRAFT_1675272 [Infundibulicybe gibba]|nr:hypothetical protein BD779DRAFT_1675272 [Infundibulicybe gibba]